MTTKPDRIVSLDIVRGIVMVLMAIDHVRVYSGLPPGGPTAGIFFTRWITHFSAPAFCFLAGTSAYLLGRKLGDTRALARYLVTRGLVLVLLELTVIRLAWTFNFDYDEYILAGVIWMLGWCMVLLAGLVRFRTRTIGIVGLVVILFQQVLYAVSNVTPESARWILRLLYLGGRIQLGAGGPVFAVLYVIVPWIGVMAAGYAFGNIMVRESAERRRLCVRIGLSATALFVAGAAVLVAVTPASVDSSPTLFRILNQQKYPASQLFLLMTLGPTIAVIPLLERARGFIADALAVFGRVPMFYYLLHIPLIHAAAMFVSLIRQGTVVGWLYGNHPMMPPPQPDGYMWSLPLLYLVFVICIVLLYFPCRWYARERAERRGTWLRYI